jgi:hypothetical protein
MTALAPGVRVKCIKQGRWEGEPPIRGPGRGSIWTVLFMITEPETGDVFIGLCEWPKGSDVFLASWFIPLDGNEDISALIDAFTKGVVDGERARIVERVR